MGELFILDDHRTLDLLACLNVYRRHDGRIMLSPTYMETEEIDRVDTISERFEMIAEWVENGQASLLEQADDFRE